MSPASSHLLDGRYRIMAALPGCPGERHFAARHVELDIPVRIISMQVGDEYSFQRDDMVGRFWARTTQAVALRHPGIVRVRDCFRQGSAFVLVLDWTPNETLAASLAAHGPLPLRDVLALGLRLCDMLGTVARQAPLLVPLGVLSPETLSQLPDGRYVLTDLGIRGWHADCRSPRCHNRLPYAAPELPAGTATAIDVRSDIYSIAAVLYAALAGEPSAPLELGRLPLTEVAPFVPPMVSAAIERALQLDPAERYATPEAFGAALGKVTRLALPDLTIRAHHTRPNILPARPALERASMRVPRHISEDGMTTSPAPRWSQVCVHELSRVATPIPFRKTGQRALAAISSALRLGA